MQRFNATEEYRKGYERGVKDKYSAESFMDNVSFNRLLNATCKDERERERGYKDGLRAMHYKHWEDTAEY